MLYSSPISKNANVRTHPARKYSLVEFQKLRQNFYFQEYYQIRQEIENKIQEIATLQANWDGYQASAIQEEVISNAKKIIYQLPMRFIQLLHSSDITPTPNGTILIEWTNNESFLLIDVGKQGISIAGKAKKELTIQKTANLQEAPDVIKQSLEAIYNERISTQQ